MLSIAKAEQEGRREHCRNKGQVRECFVGHIKEFVLILGSHKTIEKFKEASEGPDLYFKMITYPPLTLLGH